MEAIYENPGTLLLLVQEQLDIKQKRHKPPRLCESKECLRSAANLALSMDPTADPCEDFYQYVCGNWAADHPRPDAYRSYDWFRDKQTKVYSAVRDFLATNSSQQPKPVQQAKNMYAACMDTETLDKRGLKPVIRVLASLNLPPYPTFVNATDFDYSTYSFNWLEAVIQVKIQLGMDVLIGFDIFTDPKNSSVYRLVMGSPETTNPFPREEISSDDIFIFNNEHYFESNEKAGEEEKSTQIYKIFYAELIKLFVIESGGSDITKISETILDQNIFLSSDEYWTINENLYELESDNSTDSDEDLFANIPEYTVEEIQAHTDSIVESNNATASPVWKRYLEGIFNISNVELDFENDRILISDADLRYMSLMTAFVAKTPPVVMELYIWIKVMEVMSVHTTSEVRALFQRSYDAVKPHRRPPSPRSLQCASAVNDMMGMAVSYAIADQSFYNVTKPKIKTMLNEMKNALAHLVGQARWMDDDTKVETYQKIIQMKTLIGFPDWLLDEGKLEQYYEGVEITLDKHLENMINIIQVKIKKGLNRFRDGNNFTWATDPTEVNAYHTFQENTISRQFDKSGNLIPWWSNATVTAFVNMTQCFVDQYNEYYIPELDEHVDGKKTLGENIADNGGVREALAALKQHLRKHGPEQKLPGFEHMSAEQLFFLSYGNLWCGVSTKDSLEAELSDEHSPQALRARGALQNNAEFAQAWRCKPGSAMNPKKRCIIF
ncbi:hypothetical protein MSG28_004518 [Choristoneura fumiferana]|uniref:Uncharacterized protein n=1 Tax=Choristoneura fumiferana TaxID=7141 RepID=A0ACC0K696_CHOFU|nr:hypothetical protein MSG28_004518 [Choristoneura fumiferana]